MLDLGNAIDNRVLQSETQYQLIVCLLHELSDSADG